MLWSYDSWIYNYLCNQCLSPLMLWGRISIRARCTTLCDKVYQWLAIGQWFSTYPPPRYNWNIVESGIKHHQTNKQYKLFCNCFLRYLPSLVWYELALELAKLNKQTYCLQNVVIIDFIYMLKNAVHVYYFMYMY